MVELALVPVRKMWAKLKGTPVKGAGWGSRDDPMTEHNKENGNGVASNCGATGVEGGGNSGGAILGELGEQAAAAQRRVSTSIRKAGEQRGAGANAATQQVGSIAEHDTWAWAFGRA